MKACYKHWSMVVIGLALLPASLRAEFVYVANFISNDVSGYTIGTNGALTPVPGSPFPTGVTVGSYSSSVAVDRLGRFVYVTNTGSNAAFSGSVSAYSIGASGALTPVPGSPFPAGSFSSSVAVDPWGRFVYVANAFSFNVSAYRIGANGALTPVARSPFTVGNPSASSEPVSVATDPWGRFAYVANTGDSPAYNGSVSAYRIGPNGALMPVAGSPFAAGIEPVSVAVDPWGRFVYTANDGDASNGSVSAYRIGANGALRPVPGSPFTAGFTKQSEPQSVAVDPWGRFVYVVNYGTYLLSAYRIGANGALTPVPGSPFATGYLPAAVTVDLSGRFVYVTNSYIANSVSAYSIGANGALTPVPGSPFPAGDEPHSVAVAP